MPEPDEDQRAVVAWDAGPALVVGTAGTGKTTALVETVVRRIAAGESPASFVILCASRVAAARMRGAIAVRLAGAEAPWVGTVHALALVIAARAAGVEDPPRLLSGAEQERALREVIEGTLDGDAWPETLHDALGTRGFAREVRSALAAARGLGLAGDELARIGLAAEAPAWSALGPVLDAYLEAQDQRDAIDYSELLYRAVVALRDPRNGGLFAAFDTIIVDEYEECDRMQVALLAGLAGHARRLIAAANPDTAIHGFRGGDPRAVRDFPERFADMARARGLASAAFLPLRTQHRFGAHVQAFATDAFSDAVPVDLPRPIADLHRAPQATPGGEVRVRLYDDVSAEAAHVASHVRALLDAGTDPGAIAILARGAANLAAVERACARLGIPAISDVRTSRLVDQPAVRTLVRALEAVSRPVLSIDPLHAHELLVSPLCGLDASEVRGLARVLRPDAGTPADVALAAALVAVPGAVHASAADASGAAASMGAAWTSLPGARAFAGLQALLHRAHERVRAGATPHEVLWLLWSGTDWPAHLQRLALEQASAGAHRDLDAVCELFDVADRAVQRWRGHVGVASFVEELLGQEVPADTLARRGYAGPKVELLTAHAAKGREWDHVFVLDVTEGVWPDLRRRSPILDVDRLDTTGLGEARSRRARFDEERRLFHVACTRARRSLHVSGSIGMREHDGQPSRFLDNRVVAGEALGGRPQRLDGVDDIVARLRRTATSATSSEALRDAAIRRLHAMAAMRDASGQPLFPEADPETWWGVRSITESDNPMAGTDDALYVRGSSLDTLGKCALRWYLDQQVHAETPRGTAVVFGSAVHALADGVVRGDLPADVDVLAGELRGAWNAAGYDAAWQSERDFADGVDALARFVHWHVPRVGRRVVSEVTFDRVIEVRTPSGRVERLRMRGSIDRLEIVDDRHVVVFDYKTGRQKFTSREVETSGQLRYYQLAVGRGLLGDGLVPSGGSFVHLRIDAGSKDPENPAEQRQERMDADDPWVTEVLGAGLETVRDERFDATPGPHCSTCAMRSACAARPEGRQETA